MNSNLVKFPNSLRKVANSESLLTVWDCISDQDRLLVLAFSGSSKRRLALLTLGVERFTNLLNDRRREAIRTKRQTRNQRYVNLVASLRVENEAQAIHDSLMSDRTYRAHPTYRPYIEQNIVGSAVMAMRRQDTIDRVARLKREIASLQTFKRVTTLPSSKALGGEETKQRSIGTLGTSAPYSASTIRGYSDSVGAIYYRNSAVSMCNVNYGPLCTSCDHESCHLIGAMNSHNELVKQYRKVSRLLVSCNDPCSHARCAAIRVKRIGGFNSDDYMANPHAWESMPRNSDEYKIGKWNATRSSYYQLFGDDSEYPDVETRLSAAELLERDRENIAKQGRLLDAIYSQVIGVQGEKEIGVLTVTTTELMREARADSFAFVEHVVVKEGKEVIEKMAVTALAEGYENGRFLIKCPECGGLVERFMLYDHSYSGRCTQFMLQGKASDRMRVMRANVAPDMAQELLAKRRKSEAKKVAELTEEQRQVMRVKEANKKAAQRARKALANSAPKVDLASVMGLGEAKVI